MQVHLQHTLLVVTLVLLQDRIHSLHKMLQDVLLLLPILLLLHSRLHQLLRHLLRLIRHVQLRQEQSLLHLQLQVLHLVLMVQLIAAYPAGGYTGVASGPHTLTAQNAAGCTSPAANITIAPQPATPTAPTFTQVDPTCTVATRNNYCYFCNSWSYI